ncbi:hypothetical protein [Nocardia sp. NPDC004860]|uniref:hypothetical protein n=1 Tax=Nocardia sp. NPDC004860 TaxID=3154557 RepID=UPI0033B54820
MVYDISFHPLDIRLAQERVIPFLAGHGRDGDIDDLVADAVRQAKVRFRANAWGIGIHYATTNPYLVHAHYGRPFYVTSPDPSVVAETVVRYTCSSVDDVDDLARSQLALLDPALLSRVEPDMSGTLPNDERLAGGFRWKLDLLRAAAAALRTGRDTIVRPDGEKASPAGLLARNTIFVLVEFLTALLPGWIERGTMWPTKLAEQATIDSSVPMTHNTALLGSLVSEFPSLDWETNWTITTNYSVGGYAPPTQVATLRNWLSGNAEQLTTVGHRWDNHPYVRTALRKMDEALALAELTGTGFVEATDIYVPMQGIIN